MATFCLVAVMRPCFKLDLYGLLCTRPNDYFKQYRLGLVRLLNTSN